MATFQTPAIFYSQNNEKRNYYNHFNASPPSAASSSLSDSQEDLLPDLWLEQPKQEPQSHINQQPLYPHYSHLVSQCLFPQGQLFTSTQHPSQQPSGYSQLQFEPLFNQNRYDASAHTAMMRDTSLEYAQSLLPHSLLAPLTEENLDFNQKKFPSSPQECYYTFEQRNAIRQSEKQQITGYSSSVSEKLLSNSCNDQHPVDSPCTSHRNTKLRNGSVCSNNSGSKQRNINTQLYKTELCVSFMKMGVCPYGSKCQFAHGEEDLKVVERPANWRSKPCANWTKFGSCRYGKRCCFKHGN